MSRVPSRMRQWLGILTAVVGLWSILPPSLSAQIRDERAVRAAYVFNLTKYVEWPPDKNDLLICFLGAHETGEVFQKMLAGRTSESRIVHLVVGPSEEELKRCSILYIAGSQDKDIQTALDNCAAKNILTVGESDAFAQDGGMVALVKVGDQIQIQVNLEATQHSGIRISSRLLSLAVIVRTTQSERN